ncbi:hypothetical protein BCR44DRAFT_63352 [Catenaria anguillulae PL171]|uniref:Uncharacterized protein n=1 Tax=Catenaria anguillulae PL171 TaxID=765915 RepID=A0A1Y2HRI6_9FUNG|nr:hypothetical protein BCR44DRAFT_63352 [Catenaria anguillulae PL171]
MSIQHTSHPTEPRSVRDLLLTVAVANKPTGAGGGAPIERADFRDPFVDMMLALSLPSPASSVSSGISPAHAAVDNSTNAPGTPSRGQRSPEYPLSTYKLPPVPIHIDSIFSTAERGAATATPPLPESASHLHSPVHESTTQKNRLVGRTSHLGTCQSDSASVSIRTECRPRVIVHPIQFSSTRLDSEHIFHSLLEADQQPCTVSDLELRLGILPITRSPTTAASPSTPTSSTPSSTVHHSLESPTTPLTRPPLHPPTPPASPPHHATPCAQAIAVPADPDSDSGQHHPHPSRRKLHRQLESAIAAYLLGIEPSLPLHPAPNFLRATSWSIPVPTASVSDLPANHWRHLDQLKRQCSPFITDISVLLSRPFPSPVPPPTFVAPSVTRPITDALIPPAARLPSTLATPSPARPIPVHMFLDHSNILHGGRKLLASTYASLPCALSPRSRVVLDAHHLTWLLEHVLLPHIVQPTGHTVHIVKRIAVMSSTLGAADADASAAAAATSPDLLQVDHSWRAHWQVHTLHRTVQGHEHFVDELLQCCMAESMLDHDAHSVKGAQGPPVMVLLSGDGRCAQHTAGFPTHVARAVKRGWTVVVVAFSASLSGVFSRMVKVVDRQRNEVRLGGEVGADDDAEGSKVGRLWVVTLDGEVARVMRVVD